MPVWSFSELTACRTQCFAHVPDNTFKQAFARWYDPCVYSELTLCLRGSICRFVLAKTDSDAQADLEKAITGANTNITMLLAFVATGAELSGEMPHKLLHFVVDDQFQSTGMAFASPYVAQEVVKRITEDRNMEVRLLISASSSVQEFAALRGLLFEQVAHSMLQRGHLPNCRPRVC